MSRIASVACTLMAGLALGVAATCSAEMTRGAAEVASAGPLAFGPNGVLFIGDPKSATVFAIDTGDTAGDPSSSQINVEGVDGKIASMLGVTPDEVAINDLAVNPASGAAYLSVSRGRGPGAIPVLLRVSGQGEIAEFPLEDVRYDKASLPNPPADEVRGEGRRARNDRMESITDLLFLDGRLYIAGLSNEEFSSKMRSIAFPFEEADEGATIEIFHGSHGRLETDSPVRTFTGYEINNNPHLLAAYTCTPLVKIPVAALRSGARVRGDTVAELGNWNRPLDMVVYQKDGDDYLLMANSARGLMKIDLANIDTIEALTQRVEDTAGLDFDTVEEIDGVVQLDRLNADAAIALLESEGAKQLKTFELP